MEQLYKRISVIGILILKCIFIMAITESVLNINASRICSENRIITLFNYIHVFKPGIVCIQEIDVRIASKVFKSEYQVLCNYY